MITIDDVINFILTTDDLSVLPSIMDALSERVSTEFGIAPDMGSTEEAQVGEAPAEEIPAEENQPVYF